MIAQKPFTLTQGGADTGVEVAIPTNIQPGITLVGWGIAAVELNLAPNLVKSWAGADGDITLQLTKRSISPVARLVTYADTDLLESFNMALIAVGTVANFNTQVCTFILELPPGVICYSENLYIQLISTGTGVVNNAWGRILYEPVTLSQSEAFAIVASRP